MNEKMNTFEQMVFRSQPTSDVKIEEEVAENPN